MDNPGFVTEATGTSGASTTSETGSTASTLSTTDAPTSTITATSNASATTSDASATTSVDPSTGDATTAGLSTGTGSTTAPPPGCGDGVVGPNEECDDTNDDNTDTCTNQCLNAKCGDGIVWAGEEACDDGNLVDTDLCTSKCQAAACGDGIVQAEAGEQCDPADDAILDGCRACKHSCGDGEWSPDEEECEPGVVPFTEEFAALCQDACKLKSCYRFTNGANTADIDGGLEWFKPCATADGGRVVVTLIGPQGVSFLAAGVKPAGWIWTLDHLTCPPPGCTLQNQSFLPKHETVVPLYEYFSSKKHFFFAFGRGTTLPQNNPVCPSSLADGFGFALFPEFQVWPSLIAMPFMGASAPRNFLEWDKSKELSFNGGQGMNLCQAGGIKGYLGTVVVSVF